MMLIKMKCGNIKKQIQLPKKLVFYTSVKVQPRWRTVWGVLKKKLRIKLPYDPAVLLLGIFPEKTIPEKYTSTPVFIAALFTTARTWKRPRCPSTGDWIKQRGTRTQWTSTQP